MTRTSSPAKAVGSSFDSKIFAATKAFRNVLQNPRGQGSATRWLTDSRSSLQALGDPFLKHEEQVARLRGLFQEIASLAILLEATLERSYCGLPRNEEADRLANNRLHRYSVISNQAVPISLR